MTIINLNDETQEFNDDPLPIEIEQVIKLLSNVKFEWAKDYAETLEFCIENTLRCREVILSIDNPKTLKYLLQNLTRHHFEKIKKIALYLSMQNPLEHLREIRDATFDVSVSTDESYIKAKNAVATITELNIDFGAYSKELASRARQIKLLADLFCMTNLGKNYTPLMIDRLSTCASEDLDFLISMSRRISDSNLCKNV